ncbi:sulfotransferase family protein [Nitzschia inconspicua]|uniref:Sulfotransferase family protein n=1 Tax=Nitzschia inconspicua TaxID=303405 RepID=A0A9K3LXE8_9STRA|nr:sulfotransferase family protein [Nitzschia inconspicua]
MLERLATFTTSFATSLHVNTSVNLDGLDFDTPNTDGDSQSGQRQRPPGPIQMSVRYYQMWDHKTSSIQIPDEYRYFGKDKRTSLEILQDIIHSKKDQAGNDHVTGGDPSNLPQCFLPNTAPARQLAEDVKSGKVVLSDDPVIYVGFPKTGTTTLWRFFECSGYMASHQQQCPMVVQENLQGLGRGDMLLETKWSRMQRSAIDKKAKDQGKTKQQRDEIQRQIKVAHLQLDSNMNEGCYPQIQLLDEIHQDYPNATFILAFRPIDEWIRSVTSHRGMNKRWAFFEMPGLILTEDQLVLRNRTDLTLRERRPTLTDQQLRRWWCGHIHHIREYVQEYPSHRLIELDLYHEEETPSILADIFGSQKKCWGHKNRNEELAKNILNGSIPEIPKAEM